MSSWFGPLPAIPYGDEWLAHYPANRTQGKRAVGGSLHITKRSAIFQPNAMELRMGGNAWSCPRDEIIAAGIEPRRFSLFELFSGGFADRLLLELEAGVRELFVISDIAARFEEIRSILGVPIAQRGLPNARVIKR
jgi:hypothetical protein